MKFTKIPDRLAGESCESCETVPEPSNTATVMTTDGRNLIGYGTPNGDGALLCEPCAEEISIDNTGETKMSNSIVMGTLAQCPNCGKDGLGRPQIVWFPTYAPGNQRSAQWCRECREWAYA